MQSPASRLHLEGRIVGAILARGRDAVAEVRRSPLGEAHFCTDVYRRAFRAAHALAEGGAAFDVGAVADQAGMFGEASRDSLRAAASGDQGEPLGPIISALVDAADQEVEPATPAAPPLVPVRISLADARNPPLESFLLGRMLPLGKSSIIFGPSSVGKSALLAQLAFALAAGSESLWGLPLLPGGGPVLVHTAEDTVDDWKRKAAAVMHTGGIDVARALERLFIIDRTEGVARLSEVVTIRTEEGGGTVTRHRSRPTPEADACIAAAKEVGAVAIFHETASRFVDEEDNAHFSALQSELGRWGRETGAAQIMSHHATKAANRENDSTIEAARGGGAFTYNARNALALFPAEPEEARQHAERFPPEDVFTLSHGKPTSSTKRQAPVTLIRCDARFGAVFRLPSEVALGPEEEQALAARAERSREREWEQLRRLYAVVADALALGPVSPSKLREHVTEIGVGKRHLDALIRVAIDRGVLRVSSRPGGGRGVALGLGHDPRQPANPEAR